MSVFSPNRLPENPERAAAVEEARLSLKTVKAMLALPVFTDNLPMRVLFRLANDPDVPRLERRLALRSYEKFRSATLAAFDRAAGCPLTAEARARFLEMLAEHDRLP